MLGPASFVVAFGAGVASFLAPCVIPLMPAYVSYVCGEPISHLGTDRRLFQRRLFSGSLFYVVGFSLIFVPLGLTASSLGMALRNNQALLLRVGGVLVVILGLQQLGVWRRVGRAMGWSPGPLFPRIERLPKVGGALRPLLLGLVFGLAWTPCVGPILGAVLVLAAQSSSAAAGGALLFVYALGVGLPFLALSLVFVNFPDVLKPVARRAKGIATAAGVMMLGLGMLMFFGLYANLASFLARFAPGL